MVTTEYQLGACTDCLLAVAGAHEDPPQHVVEALTEWTAQGVTLVNGGDDTWFSTYPCGVCGDKAAGDRHEVFGLVPLRQWFERKYHEYGTTRTLERAWSDWQQPPFTLTALKPTA